jgi:hypothetical protein
LVQCSCGAEPHRVYDYNLRNGKSTRCNSCAKKKAGHWRKSFYAYADIVPDAAHRRRLLNRISACITRCHNPNDAGYASYGGRGIHVFEDWRQGSEGRRKFLGYLVTLTGWDIPKMDIDRIDVDQGYQPGNLRFISRRENCQNKRSMRAMQDRIVELEAHIRFLERGAAK